MYNCHVIKAPLKTSGGVEIDFYTLYSLVKTNCITPIKTATYKALTCKCGLALSPSYKMWLKICLQELWQNQSHFAKHVYNNLYISLTNYKLAVPFKI